MNWLQDITLFGLIVLSVHVVGFLNAAHAVMNVRLSQSATAWSISLITFPWIAIPLYWTLGQSKFRGYTDAIRQAYRQYEERTLTIVQNLFPYLNALPAELSPLKKTIQTLAEVPFTSGNCVELLIDGERTYEALLAAIADAQDYILFQFYIINDDASGRRFLKALTIKAQQGVQVYVLYDGIGSHKISRQYLADLAESGIHVAKFKSTKGGGNPFQINFRNHRKIVIVDGAIAFTGGLNIGDEYVGKVQKFGKWRDTHLSLRGPAVQCLQISFLKDWYWATGKIPETRWDVQPDSQHNEAVLILPSGPNDTLQTCTLFFNSLFGLAESRIWIATPYFVPDEPTLAALKMAALRGVDVRILLPDRPDHLIVYLCSFAYYEELQHTGIKLYRYKTGFMHQKAILVDHILAGVGTVNLDNRSFHLNFEVMAYMASGSGLRDVEQMLLADLEQSYLVDLFSFELRSLWFRLAVRIAQLMAPLQ